MARKPRENPTPRFTSFLLDDPAAARVALGIPENIATGPSRNTKIIKSDATLDPGDWVFADSTDKAINLYLPQNPAIGDIIDFLDVGGSTSTNYINIYSNEQSITFINGPTRRTLPSTDPLQVNLPGAKLDIVFVGGIVGWYIITNSGPKGDDGNTGDQGISATFQLPSRAITPINANYSSTSADRRQMLSAPGGITINLESAVQAGNGTIIGVEKVGNSSQPTSIKSDGVTLGNVYSTADKVVLRANDEGVWKILFVAIAPILTIISGQTATQTGKFTLDPNCKTVDLIMVSASGSSASGSTSAPGNAGLGGGGAASGNVDTPTRIRAAKFGSNPIDYIVPGPTPPPAGVSSPSSPGINGTVGGTIVFGPFSLRGGNPGNGNGTGGNALSSGRSIEPVASGATSIATGTPSPPVEAAVGAGGAGGGISSSNVAQNGGPGGVGSARSATRPAQGLGGVAGGALAGGAGGDATDEVAQRGGSGGGGGAGSTNSDGGPGGPGGFPGGGPGGGGAARNGFTSGAGAAGSGALLAVRQVMQ